MRGNSIRPVRVGRTAKIRPRLAVKEVEKTNAKRNALPLAGGYHAASTAALHVPHAGAKLDFALDFFA
jgi:hypothetical protein